jgi:hypothetical protein
MKLLCAFALSLALALAGAGAFAKTAQAPTDVQTEYDQFIAAFRVALKDNNCAAVTEMTRLPFMGDKAADAQQFRKKTCGELFPAKIRNCIARRAGVYDRSPDGDHSFSVFCGEQIYVFTKTPAGFRFTDVSVND